MAEFAILAMEIIDVFQAGVLGAAYLGAIPLIAIEWDNVIDILEGSGQLFLGTVKSLKFVPDILDAGITLFEFSISYLICTLKMLANIKKCWFYYVLDAIGQLIYLPIRISLWTVYSIGIDLYSLECRIWSWIDLLDRFIFTKTGVHLIHYPKSVRDDCYNCCRVKIDVLAHKGDVVYDDFMQVVPQLIWPGIMHIIRGVSNFMDPF